MAINLATIKPAVLKAKDVATVNDIEIAEANFNAAIATTNSYVTTINNTLSDIASDAKLTAGEKQAVKREWETIVAEKPSLVDQATLFVVSSVAYTGKYDALNSYLNTPIGSALLTSLATTSDIVSSTFTTKFKEYYTAKIDLLNALAAKAKEIADSKTDTTYVNNIINTAADTLNDNLAIKLGYANYAELSAAASDGNTIISGGKIKTSLIETRGLIAENIAATEIQGKKISGSTISGSVIKTSFIDLDDTVGFLTSYSILPSQYNASLMPDAVYVAASNLYKLPTAAVLNINNPNQYSVDNIYAYNNFSVGRPVRCAAEKPTILIPSTTTMCSVGYTVTNSAAYQTPASFYIIIGGIEYPITMSGYNNVNFNGHTGVGDVFYVNGLAFQFFSEATVGTYCNGFGWSGCTSYATSYTYMTYLRILEGQRTLVNSFNNNSVLFGTSGIDLIQVTGWGGVVSTAPEMSLTFPTITVNNFGG